MTLDDLFDMEDRARNTCPDATIELTLAELSALTSQIARLDQNHQALEAENKRLEKIEAAAEVVWSGSELDGDISTVDTQDLRDLKAALEGGDGDE